MSDDCSDLPGTDGLAPKQRYQAKQRELFLSRHVETLPATHIRGKCSVTLLNETESLLSYLNKDVSMYRPHGRPGRGGGVSYNGQFYFLKCTKTKFEIRLEIICYQSYIPIIFFYPLIFELHIRKIRKITGN